MRIVVIKAVALALGLSSVMHFPSRPPQAVKIKMMEGVVKGYILSTDVVAEHLIVRDARTADSITFELSASTTINGHPSGCSVTEPCAELPGIIPGKTRVAVLYWATNPAVVGAVSSQVIGSGFYGTDELVVIR